MTPPPFQCGYDTVGNLLTVNYPASPDLTFQYNPLNRVTRMIAASGTTDYAYFPGGRLQSENGPFANDTVSYTYNNLRRRESMTVQYASSSSWVQNYTYDTAPRLATVVSPAGTFTYTYAGTDTRVGNLALPTGGSIQNTYDTLDRLTGTYLKNSGGTTQNSHTYVYSAANQRTNQTRFDNSYVRYAYDPAGQLTWAKATNSSGQRITAEAITFGFDAGWNMVKRTNDTAVTTYTVNSLNQVTGDGTYVWSYDANGNRTQRNNNTYYFVYYVYDDENQLIEARTDTSAYGTPVASRWKTQFKYDGRGRLRQRVEYNWNTYGGGV